MKKKRFPNLFIPGLVASSVTKPLESFLLISIQLKRWVKIHLSPYHIGITMTPLPLPLSHADENATTNEIKLTKIAKSPARRGFLLFLSRRFLQN